MRDVQAHADGSNALSTVQGERYKFQASNATGSLVETSTEKGVQRTT